MRFVIGETAEVLTWVVQTIRRAAQGAAPDQGLLLDSVRHKAISRAQREASGDAATPAALRAGEGHADSSRQRTVVSPIHVQPSLGKEPSTVALHERVEVAQ